MCRNCISLLLSLLIAAVALAQAPQRIQTTTRLVMIFSNLENQLTDAVATGKTDDASRLLTEDFEEWTPQPPGSPTPRDQWLAEAGEELANGRIRQMAVKGLGDHAIADFILVAGDKAFFIVDVWQKQGTDWRLQQRYRAPVDASVYRGPVHPSGKD